MEMRDKYKQMASCAFAQRQVERLMNAVECAIVTPEVEILPDRAAWRKVPGQMTSLAAGLQKRGRAIKPTDCAVGPFKQAVEPVYPDWPPGGKIG